MSNPDRDFLILVIYLMYEKLKGEHSFYEPYLSVVNPGVLTWQWDELELDKIDDKITRQMLKDTKEASKEEFEGIVKLVMLYPQFFSAP